MTDAYVNVYVDAGAVRQAAEEIQSIDAAKTVHVVTGEYDLVVQLDLDDSDDLPDVVANEIHPVSGVIETVTNVAFDV